MHSTTIAVDVAKSVFAIAVSTEPGRIDRQVRLTRGRFLEFFARQKPAVVVLEACGSAHHWSRQLTTLWALRLERSGGHNKAAVALANKLARIAWAVSTSERDLESYPLPEAA